MYVHACIYVCMHICMYVCTVDRYLRIRIYRLDQSMVASPQRSSHTDYLRSCMQRRTETAKADAGSHTDYLRICMQRRAETARADEGDEGHKGQALNGGNGATRSGRRQCLKRACRTAIAARRHARKQSMKSCLASRRGRSGCNCMCDWSQISCT